MGMRNTSMSKVWFITGAGSGIGAGIAKAALKAGDRVVATGRNVDKLRKALGGHGNENLAFVQLDVANEGQAKAAVEQTVQRFGRLDVLVNNAGFSLLGNFEELTTPALEAQFATNFWGVAYVMRAGLPVMRKQRSGHIINISSTAGVVGLKHCSAYGATKFAVEGLSLAVAQEVEQFGIKVTIVEPGFFLTDLLAVSNVKYADSTVADYAPEGTAEAMWSPYDGKQTGSPDKLGDALVELTRMTNPPQVFVGGSDALAMVTPAIEARLKDMHAYDALSRSTDIASKN
jgi:NAD(P)-dependent dehydrogenase (short-subunit alcohol dehydrogenase family)